MAIVQIDGDPTIVIEFTGLPSVNTHYNKHFRARGVSTNEWRLEAREKARDILLWTDAVPVKRAFALVKVYPPYEEISDIHNVHIKPLLDGFTDAGIWADDEWAFLPLVMHLWGGIGEQKPRQHKIRRTVIEIYELEALFINGSKQRLPKGRVRL
jgi:hypothetical protein